jgi:hypothetical protein
MLPCLAYHQVNETCVLQNLATVRQQLTQILSTLRAADPSLRIVGAGHYDPYLYAHIHSIAVQSFASASIALIDRLNETLRVVYSAAGVPMANVGSAFARSQTRFQRHLQIEPRPLRISYAYVPSRGHAPLRLWATHIPTRTATKPSLMSCGHDYRMAALATAWRTTRGGLSSQRCATSTWRPSGVTLNQAMRPMPGFPIEPT